jgi:aminocarboxymuconate-semialdehyde decarboxylase
MPPGTAAETDPSIPAVIDCQWHWVPAAYLDVHLGRSSFPAAERVGDGYAFRTGAERSLVVGPEYFDLDVQLERMDAAGIATVVTSSAQFGVDGLPAAEARELAQLLNEERAAAQRRLRGRFLGLATLPMQDTHAALEVLDDAILRLGLPGVCLLSNIAGEALDAERFWPVYERIEALDVPLFLHPTRSVMEDRLRRHGLEYSVGFMFDSSLAALGMVLGGVLERHPGLTIVHPHLGGTVPFLAGRIDEEYDKPWARSEIPLSMAPSAYLRRFYTDTVGFGAGALRLARDFYGVAQMLFASDFRFCSPSERIAFVRDHLDGAEAVAVLHDNAAGLLGLDR